MELKMYFLFQIIFLFIFILNKNFVKSEEYCPKICECDLYNGFNRATCSGQKLINANIEISELVEIFDLNYNKISVLDNVCFKEQIHLTNLSIAHNKIHTIHFNAFSTLKKLKSINLSHNQLQYINERIFEYNYQLIEVNLSGNQFFNLINEPLFISTSVQRLFLHDSRIDYIYPKIFSKISSLRYLDLSKNLMITLTTEPFNPLTKLNEINLEDNRWACDKNIENVINTLTSKQVKIKLTMCDLELKKHSNVVKFEKIMVDPNLQISNEEYDHEEKSEKPLNTVWNKIIVTDSQLESCLINDIRFACNLYKSCLKNLTITSQALQNSENDMKNFKKEKYFFYTIDNTELIFFFGICIGAAIVFIMVACTVCIKQCCKPKQDEDDKESNELVPANREFRFFHGETPHGTNELPPPIPVRVSSRRRRRRPPPPPPLNRSISSPARGETIGTINDFASFVTRIFERPARHRYYRAFNENTTNLIRRLSRSSLVNNRLSQHFLNETVRNRNDRNNVAFNDRERNGRERLGSVENDEQIDELQLFIQMPNDSNVTSIETNNTGTDTQLRSQTPPPAYNEVVKH